MSEGPHSIGAALAEAQTIIAAAEERAAKLVSDAKANADEIRAKAYSEGLVAGESASAAAAIRMIEDLSALRQSASREAAKLAVAICRSVLSLQAEIDPTIVQSAAERALSQSIVGGELQILANTNDVKALEAIKDKLKLFTGGAVISILGDDQIERGGCIIRTEFGEIDASLAALIDGISQKLGISNGR
jgi:flagellar assembly protein FliH